MNAAPPAPGARKPIGALAAIGLALLLAVLALALGIWASLLSGDWTWLARSGAVLVVLGVVFAYFNVDHWIERGIADSAAALHARLAGSRIVPRRLVALAAAIDARASGNPIPNTVKLIEVLIVITGTLIWAFADLLGGAR